MASQDKFNPHVKDQDTFPSEVCVGKFEYVCKHAAESRQQRTHVRKVGWNMLHKLDFVSSAL